jgi:hypothetical protein
MYGRNIDIQNRFKHIFCFIHVNEFLRLTSLCVCFRYVPEIFFIKFHTVEQTTQI